MKNNVLFLVIVTVICAIYNCGGDKSIDKNSESRKTTLNVKQ